MKKIDFNRFISKIDQFYIKIAIVNSILIVGIRIDVNRRSNLKSKFDSMTTIQFAIPNCISLNFRHILKKAWFWKQNCLKFIGFSFNDCLKTMFVGILDTYCNIMITCLGQAPPKNTEKNQTGSRWSASKCIISLVSLTFQFCNILR